MPVIEAIKDLIKKNPAVATSVLAVIVPLVFAKLGVWPFALIYGRKKRLLQGAQHFNRSYDYIVVGGGSAGCVVANRLSEDPNVTVLLIEAGGNGLKDSSINTPLLFSTTQETEKDWKDLTVRQSETRNRIHYWPRGRVLGGCSSVNAIIYARGAHADFDRWEKEHGCDGWAFKNLLPYFKKSEGVVIPTTELDAGYHGHEGGLKVSRSTNGRPNRMSHMFVEACAKIGLGKQSRYRKDERGNMVGVDYNGEDIYGAGVSQTTAYKGVRCDTATAFLASIMDPNSKGYRPNLTVATDLMVTKLSKDARTYPGGIGIHGVEVWAQDKFGKKIGSGFITVKKEVVVCCGAVNSPKLLKLSGIGPSDELASHNIPVLKNLPGVGQNLRDHLCVGVARQDLTNSVYRVTPATIIKGLFDYNVFKTGMFACGGVEAVAFTNVKEDSDLKKNGQPDMQLHLISISVEGKQADKMRVGTAEYGPISAAHPTAHDPTDTARGMEELASHKYVKGPFISIAPTILHPKSTGTITLASSNPADLAVIDPQYLTHQDDVDVLAKGMDVARKVFAEMEKLYPGTLGLEDYDRALAREVGRVTGCAEGREYLHDVYIKEYVRRSAVTLYHPVGTCKMGPSSDPLAVVCPKTLKVHGFANLRVADASVMPTLVSANTNAASIVVGEVVAAMIKGEFNRAK
ncbi:hypothetical protein HDU97_008957 [Phlyctochytrium planicorne]|nr:hypothetical protein HDU97_008957 [Phlyctochytrium planicorne]